MTARLTDLVVRHIEAVIEELDIPQAVKDQVEYEVINFLTPTQSGLAGPPSLAVAWMAGVGLPTQSGDHLMPFAPLEDPHDQAEIRRLVQGLFAQAQHEVAEADLELRKSLNGHRTSPGGLAIPN